MESLEAATATAETAKHAVENTLIRRKKVLYSTSHTDQCMVFQKTTSEKWLLGSFMTPKTPHNRERKRERTLNIEC